MDFLDRVEGIPDDIPFSEKIAMAATCQRIKFVLYLWNDIDASSDVEIYNLKHDLKTIYFKMLSLLKKYRYDNDRI